MTASATCTVCNLTGCVSCDNAVYCNQCKPGYILSGSGRSSKCTKCASSCATCIDSPDNCDTCAGGFSKNGWNCINNNNIKLEIKLTGVFTSLTTAQYLDIEQSICDKTGKDRSQINI